MVTDADQSGEADDAALTKRPLSICLTCRTLLEPGTRCDGEIDGSADCEVVSLASAENRARLRDTVWPDRRPSWVRLLRRRLYVWAHPQEADGCFAFVFILAPLMVLPLSGLVFGATNSTVAILVCWAIAAPFLVYGIVVSRLAKWPAGHASPRPHGVQLPYMAHDGLAQWVGTVRGEAELVAPVTGEPCIGYSVVGRARHTEAGSVVLREERCGSFEVRLDEQDVPVAVPRGRVRLLQGVKRCKHDFGPPDSHLGSRGVPWLLAPGDELCEHWLADGDRVELRGSLDEPGEGKRAGAYRDGRRVLVPEGIVWLEVIEELDGP